MDTKHTHDASRSITPFERIIRFCLNCDDMEDLALSDEGQDIDGLYERFANCLESGNFQGDVCSRLFIVKDGIVDADLFMDEDDED